MPRIHTAVVPDRTEKIAFFCRDENENPLPSPVLETGPVHVEPGDTVVIQVPVNERGDRPLVIYIGGPYSAPTLAEREANTRRAMRAFLAILAKGHYPICPHLSHYPHEHHKQVTGKEIPYQVWIELDKQYLVRCDALYYLAPSPGADGELRLAQRAGLIVFRDLQDIPDLTGDAWARRLVPVEPGPGLEGGYQPVAHLENPVPPGAGPCPLRPVRPEPMVKISTIAGEIPLEMWNKMRERSWSARFLRWWRKAMADTFELRSILGCLMRIHSHYHHAREILEGLMLRDDLPENVREKFRLLDLPHISEFHRLDAAMEFIKAEIEKAEEEGA